MYPFRSRVPIVGFSILPKDHQILYSILNTFVVVSHRSEMDINVYSITPNSNSFYKWKRKSFLCRTDTKVIDGNYYWSVGLLGVIFFFFSLFMSFVVVVVVYQCMGTYIFGVDSIRQTSKAFYKFIFKLKRLGFSFLFVYLKYIDRIFSIFFFLIKYRKILCNFLEK